MGTELRVAISEGNRKLTKIPNVSLPPIITCRKDVPCAEACYAMKAWRQYPAVRNAWGENLALYKEDPASFFSQIATYLKKREPERFRFHVGGDFPDQEYLDRAFALARAFRCTQFLAFTKKYELSFRHQPDNFSIVLSTWPGLCVPFYSKMPKAWLSHDERRPEEYFQCSGICDDCDLCWKLAGMGLDVCFHQH